MTELHPTLTGYAEKLRRARMTDLITPEVYEHLRDVFQLCDPAGHKLNPMPSAEDWRWQHLTLGEIIAHCVAYRSVERNATDVSRERAAAFCLKLGRLLQNLPAFRVGQEALFPDPGTGAPVKVTIESYVEGWYRIQQPGYGHRVVPPSQLTIPPPPPSEEPVTDEDRRIAWKYATPGLKSLVSEEKFLSGDYDDLVVIRMARDFRLDFAERENSRG